MLTLTDLLGRYFAYRRAYLFARDAVPGFDPRSIPHAGFSDGEPRLYPYRAWLNFEQYRARCAAAHAASGLSHKEIAVLMRCSPPTVKRALRVHERIYRTRVNSHGVLSVSQIVEMERC